jgi:Ca2+-binding EF-hand superfamily protein
MDILGGSTKHSKEDEKRFAQLFEQLDRNQDGKLDVHELKEGIERLGLPSTSGTAQVNNSYSTIKFHKVC